LRPRSLRRDLVWTARANRSQVAAGGENWADHILERLNIAIAGAGIAGLSAAAFLALAGHRVTLFDKAQKPAPVGSGLIVQPTGQAALAALGLSDELTRRGARLERLDGRLGDGKRKVLDVRYGSLGEGAHGVSVHRAALFDMLNRAAAKAGAAIEAAREIASVDAGTLLFVDGTASPRFDLVVDALGVRSPLVARENFFLQYGALWANAPFPSAYGFSETVLTQRYRGADCSAGIMPIGTLRDGEAPLAAFFWALRADHYETWRMTPLDRWKDRVRDLWPEAAPVLAHFTSHDQFVFAHYAHHTAQEPVEGRVVHIGDAWHAASPQLGQGANMALLDAWALSAALAKGDDIDAALAAFVKLRGAHVKLYQAISYLFTPVYQSDLKLIPALRDRFAEPLSSFWFMPKVLAAMVAGTLGGPLKRLHPPR
jgi:2-polyprenyl-6-methoxyphenol hydroxylase-like FAD-dependent oxidoreductase